MSVPKDQEVIEDLTKLEGYQETLKLLNLAFNSDHEEIKKMALEHGGLEYLKRKGYDCFMNIQNIVGKDAELDS
jgi:hypothetical protein